MSNIHTAQSLIEGGAHYRIRVPVSPWEAQEYNLIEGQTTFTDEEITALRERFDEDVIGHGHAEKFSKEEWPNYFEIPLISEEAAAKLALHENKQNELNQAVNEFEAALARAEKIAAEHNLEFSIDPAYGMGGWFTSGEWHPSSQSC